MRNTHHTSSQAIYYVLPYILKNYIWFASISGSIFGVFFTLQCIRFAKTMTLHEWHDVWTQRQFDCLLKGLFRLIPKKTSKLRIFGPLWMNPPVAGGTPLLKQQHRLLNWGRDKMDAISQTTFSSAFSWMKMFEFRLKFHRSLFLRVQLTIFQHWFR